MPMTSLPNPRYQCKISQHLPAANTAAVVTLAAVVGQRHVITKIDFGYAVVAPTAGTGLLLTVSGLNEDGAMTYTVPSDIKVGLQQAVFEDHPLIGKVNGAVVVTLAAGGGTSVAELNVLHAL